MKQIDIVNGPQGASQIILGCMRMPALNTDDAANLIRTAYELGINFFDHATCYGRDGEAETRFGDAFPKTGIRREDVYIQSKCGILSEKGEFNWSKETILESVNDSLRRLKLDYLDALLLHRPDLLYEPEQIAEAFDELEKSGKVRFFGVSNVPTMMLEVLRKYIRQPLVFNQLQFSLDQSQLIDQTLYVNNLTSERSIDRDNGTLDYCRLHDITVQAWSPLQKGLFQGCFVDDPELHRDRDRLDPAPSRQDPDDRRNDEYASSEGYLRGDKGRPHPQRMVSAVSCFGQVSAVRYNLIYIISGGY